MNRVVALAIVLATSVMAFALSAPLSAHITAVSPYTYHRDVLPIFEARCGRCHTDGSASGLSLLHYAPARAATFQIRQRLVRGHMPPWFADGPFTSPEPITPRELNVIMTWATGGGPEGKAIPHTAPATTSSWPLGPPDAVVDMPSPFTFNEPQGDLVHEVVLRTARIGGRTIRAVDLLPGTPSLVRSAEIIARSGAREQVLGLWQPGEQPSPLAISAGFQLPSNAVLLARIRYRRQFGAPASDRSQVGVYFSDRQALPIHSMTLDTTSPRTQTQTLQRRARLLAMRPVAGSSGAIAHVTILRNGGGRSELARIEFQKDWARRYVFDAPMTLAAGDKIEMTIESSRAALFASLTGEPTDAANGAQVVLEFVN